MGISLHKFLQSLNCHYHGFHKVWDVAGAKAARKHSKHFLFSAMGERMSGFSSCVNTLDDNLLLMVGE
jgi:hypothetical protein